ncbi:MAG: exodeoxyribonuclease VII small subunit [Planctomycetota bacterium]|nr:MAG: exodeoxyribonuclease VII small subunit [Planctomycetota bacterium]
MAKKSFESSLEELESLVEKLEENSVSLEETLKMYEKGIALFGTCESFLKKAEGKFKVLVGEEEKILNLKETTVATLEDLESSD